MTTEQMNLKSAASRIAKSEAHVLLQVHYIADIIDHLMDNPGDTKVNEIFTEILRSTREIDLAKAAIIYFKDYGKDLLPNMDLENMTLQSCQILSDTIRSAVSISVAPIYATIKNNS